MAPSPYFKLSGICPIFVLGNEKPDGKTVRLLVCLEEDSYAVGAVLILSSACQVKGLAERRSSIKPAFGYQIYIARFCNMKVHRSPVIEAVEVLIVCIHLNGITDYASVNIGINTVKQNVAHRSIEQ